MTNERKSNETSACFDIGIVGGEANGHRRRENRRREVGRYSGRPAGLERPQAPLWPRQAILGWGGEGVMDHVFPIGGECR